MMRFALCTLSLAALAAAAPITSPAQTIPAHEGLFAFEITRTDASFVGGMDAGIDRDTSAGDLRIPVTAGNTYEVGAYLRTGELIPDSPTIRFRTAFFRSNQTFIADSADFDFTITDDYDQYSAQVVAPAEAAFMNIAWRAIFLNGSFVIDLVTVTDVTDPLNPLEVTVTNGDFETFGEPFAGTTVSGSVWPAEWRIFAAGGSQVSVRPVPEPTAVGSGHWSLYQ